MPVRISLMILFAGLLAPAIYAQDCGENKEACAANPPGLIFELGTKGGQKAFHLGEIIELEERYSADAPKKYYVLAQPANVEGGYSTKLSILPDEDLIDRTTATGRVSAQAILIANCMGYGISGGASGVCADCGGRLMLGREPIRFPYALNYRFTIAKPGHYTIAARAGNIVLSNAASEQEKALEVTSKPLEIEILRDENWASQQLAQAVSSFEAAKRNYQLERWDERPVASLQGDELMRETKIAKEMNDAAQVIRFLDTEESLAQAVRFYDGSLTLAGYANPFWNAVLESSHRKLAVKLLADRMLGEDFLASEDFVDVLTAMSIQQEQPEVFNRGDDAARKQLSLRTVEILKGYVLGLGKSLAAKEPAAREAGAKTFEHYAAQKYCSNEALIETGVAREILLRARNAIE
jgi:hypothetical protein